MGKFMPILANISLLVLPNFYILSAIIMYCHKRLKLFNLDRITKCRKKPYIV